MSALRPYRRRLVVLVILAALAGAALGEFGPKRPLAASGSSTTHQSGR